MKENIKYFIITPTKNEGKYISITIESVLNQTIKPIKWFIINDYSTDNTKKIIKKYQKKHSWIKLIDSKQKKKWDPGGKQIKMFYEAYNQIKNSNWNFIVKLDADMKFEKNYFEKLFLEFEKNKKLGVTSGKYEIKQKSYHTIGGSKIYRKNCFIEEILVPLLSWDSIDEIIAEMNGWEVMCFDIPIIHLKKEGSIDGQLKRRFYEGLGHYVKKSSPVYVIFRGTKKLTQKPRFISSFAFILGYISGFLSKKERYNNDEFTKFLRKKEIERIKKLIHL